ncbi:TPA: hypothetical protein DCZ81_01665 [Candidatus Collierbacteria bacterium]|nr:hypothetical protein [Candidatus Collierbacteria bacterium]
MNEKIRPAPVDFNSEKIEIVIRANDEGALGDIESWKEAFPEVKFMDVDEAFSGDEIDWNQRTVVEKALFVAFMRDPKSTSISYEMKLDNVYLSNIVTDSERVWWMWMAGCFSGGKLDEKAIRTFLWYVDESDLARQLTSDVDLEEVKNIKYKIKVAPLE